ncbi:MAG: hypothetical protein IKF44_01125, partial [Mycoplasmataceae bacterium]|nr:hypothetical protein [Mycoplasmataceae bacterium]
MLCTNNENNIAKDITRERIYRVINGEGSKGQKIDWQYSEDKKSLKNNSVKYLTVKSINKYDGQNGMTKNMYGARGKDIVVKVPFGTLVY